MSKKGNEMTGSEATIPGPQSYVTLLDAVMAERTAEGNAKASSPIRPSNAGSCTRRMAHDYLAYLGKAPKIEETRKPSVERLLKLGHFIEEHVVDDLKSIPGMGVRFQQQLVEMFELPGGTRVEGSLDAFMWAESVRGVLDVKSIGDRWHNHFNSKWDSLLASYRPHAVEFDTNSFYVDDLAKFLAAIGSDDSLYKNLIQLNLYACTDFLQKRKCDHASIIRYNKNNSALMEIRFKPSREVFEHTKARLAAVEEAGNSGDVAKAPKERVLGQMDCTYCPYKAECWPTARKADFYKNSGKKWVTKTSELELGDKVEELFALRVAAEQASENLAKYDRELLIMLDGHGINKVKCKNGDVFEVKQLAKSVELRRSKE
jgi:hypothetical protein